MDNVDTDRSGPGSDNPRHPAQRTSQRRIRLVFAATALLITFVQYGVLALTHTEPYPAVILPGFPAKCPGCPLEAGAPTIEEPLLTAQFAGGDRQQLPFTAIVPRGPSLNLAVFTAAFKEDAFTHNAAAVNWLKARIAGRFPGRTPTGLDITWGKATYFAADPSAKRYTPERTIHVDFGTTS